MYKNLQNIKFLVGDNKFEKVLLTPYDDEICNFLGDFSKELSKKIYNDFIDLKSLSFWCRKNNLNRIKKSFFSKEIRSGIGLIFHVTPSNVPTNFMYSLIFGLLTGNSNIVKVPSKNFDQIEIICKIINNLINKKKFKNIKKMIKIVKYENNNDEFTKFLSSICDVRIIWGGDKSIERIRKFPINSRSFDLTFADRYSISILNTKTIKKISNNDLENLVKKFYNDVFIFDQNACSSPHLIFWLGFNEKNIRFKFWEKLSKIVKEKYNIPDKAAVDKFSQFCRDTINLKEIKSQKKFGNTIYTILLKEINSEVENLRGKWGYFYEKEISNLSEIKNILTNKFQTMTYFGINKRQLETFARSNLKGIDRIVPIGQALEISLIWDGYDINKTLTRIIDIK